MYSPVSVYENYVGQVYQWLYGTGRLGSKCV